MRRSSKRPTSQEQWRDRDIPYYRLPRWYYTFKTLPDEYRFPFKQEART